MRGIVRVGSWAVLSTLCCGLATAQAPTVSAGGVVNAADYTAEIAPGAIVAIFGVNLASGTTTATKTPLPTTLVGVSVEVVDGAITRNAPLFFVSPRQINAQMPLELAGNPVQLRVRNAGGASPAVSVGTVARAPRLFTKTLDGKGEPILLHADYTLVSADSPARTDETVILYLTGLGAVAPAVQSGVPSGDGSEQAPLNLVTPRPDVTVGGKPAQVLFAGLAPYFVGLYQLNIRMPATVSSGQQPVVVTAGNRSSQAGVQAAVRSSWQPVTAASVGSQGATLSGAGTTITVPAGAFQNAEALSISRIPGDGTAAGDYYLLDGMPLASRGNITIAVDGGPLPGDDGEPVIAIRVDGTAADPTLRFIRAQYQGGKIVATLPAFDAQSTKPQAGPAVRAAVADRPSWMYYALRGYKPNTSASRMFVVMATKDVPAGRASQLADAADNAYNRLGQDLRLQWDRLAAQYWPIEIWVYRFTGGFGSPPPTNWGNAPEPFWRNSGTVHLNATYTQTDAQMAIMIPSVGHELFHVLQNLYDPRTGSQMKWGATTSWLWYEEAASTWFERMVSNDPPNYLPSTLSPNAIRNEEKSNNYDFIKTGLASPNQADHGYGASMFLQHLSNRFGGRLIADILKLMATPDPASSAPWPRYTPMQAMAQQGSISLDAEWKEFCRNYMAGTLYGRPQGDRFPTASNITGGLYTDKYVMANPNDHVFSFATWDAPDLSANVYGVLFNKVTLRDNTPLTVRVDYSNAELILYRAATGNILERIADRVTEYTINNAELLERNRDQLVIMVVNPRAVEPYTGTTPITVSVQIGTAFVMKPYNTIELYVGGDHAFRAVNSPVQASYLFFGNAAFNIVMGGRPIAWNGNSFSLTTGKITVTSPYSERERDTGDMTISGSIDPSRQVISVTYKMSSSRECCSDDKTPYSSSQEQYSREVIFRDVPCPIPVPTTGVIIFRGALPGSYVTGIKYSSSSKNNYGGSNSEQEYTGTNWNSSQYPAYLQVNFSNRTYK